MQRNRRPEPFRAYWLHSERNNNKNNNDIVGPRAKEKARRNKISLRC